MSELVQKLIRAAEGGVCRSLDELVEEETGKELADLTHKQLAEIDDALFTCSLCDWTMPRDCESEEEDGLCQECEE